MFVSLARLCTEYENIAERALTTPANTEQLMELRQFVETTQKVCLLKTEPCILIIKILSNLWEAQWLSG